MAIDQPTIALITLIALCDLVIETTPTTLNESKSNPWILLIYATPCISMAVSITVRLVA